MKNLLWNASDPFRDLDSQLEWPPQPQTDLAFGFRIWNGREGNFQGREIGPAKENFSFKVLQALSRSDMFHAMPSVHSMAEEVEPSDRLFGFPFAVVELKSDKVEKRDQTTCLCQAANSASTSLKIQEMLWEKAGDRGQHPPVISFTCIGAEITLWLAFTIRGKNGKIGDV